MSIDKNDINGKNRYTKENLLDCLEKSNNYKELILNLGLKPCTNTYRRVQEKLEIFGIDHKRLSASNLKLYDESELKEAVAKSYNYNDVLRCFNRDTKGGNLAILKKYIQKYDISVEHFIKTLNINIGLQIEDILVENSTYNNTHNLKLKLYKLGLKNRYCEECGQDENWRGKKISLILDHINGVNNDNRIENLRILCPNCNATLDTHCGKNRKMKKEKPTLVQKEKKYGDDDILGMVGKYGYVKTGKHYGVSDNAVRRWIRNLGYDPKTLLLIK